MYVCICVQMHARADVYMHVCTQGCICAVIIAVSVVVVVVVACPVVCIYACVYVYVFAPFAPLSVWLFP